MLHEHFARILNTITEGYIAAAVFTDLPRETIPVADVAYFAAAETCADFMRQAIDAGLADEYACTRSTWDAMGHDLWLTRNGHGAGFWDRGLGDLGQRLTELAKGMGTRGMYVGDDGRAYFE